MLGRWHSHTMQALANRGQSPREVWYYAPSQVALHSQTGVVSHTFADGIGKIKYNAPVVSMPTTLSGTPITDIVLAPKTTDIGANAFRDCSSLALTELPDRIASINATAFRGCTSLALDRLTSQLAYIGNGAFYGCTQLSLAEIPPLIVTIAASAFNGCTGLTELTFLGTPNSIGSTAFSGCRNLATIRVPWAEGAVANAPWGANNATITYNYTPQ